MLDDKFVVTDLSEIPFREIASRDTLSDALEAVKVAKGHEHYVDHDIVIVRYRASLVHHVSADGLIDSTRRIPA